MVKNNTTKKKSKKSKKKSAKKYTKKCIQKGGGRRIIRKKYDHLVGSIVPMRYSNVANGVEQNYILYSSRVIKGDFTLVYLNANMFEEQNKDRIPLQNNKQPGKSWYDSDNTDGVGSGMIENRGDFSAIDGALRNRKIKMYGGSFENSIAYYKQLHSFYSTKVQDIYDSYNNNIDLTKLKQLQQQAANSPATLPTSGNFEDDTQKNNVMKFFREKKCIEKCKEYLSIMKKKINLTMTPDKIEERNNIKSAYESGAIQINSVEGMVKSFGELYGETPWGNMGGKYVPTYDGCQSFAIISTVVDFAVRMGNKHICVPHGIDLSIHRKFSGAYSGQKNLLEAINIPGNPLSQDDILCFPLQPSLSIRSDYKEYAWQLATQEAQQHGQKYLDSQQNPITANKLKKAQKHVKIYEESTGKNLYPVENLGQWYVTDFKKKIPSYKKNVDPNFNIPSKIRYAIERCLFNTSNLEKYNPDNICGIYLPLGVTTGIEYRDNNESTINHANLVYIHKVSKDANGKFKLKLYLFDPNYDPTFYLRDRLNEVIKDINASQNEYEIEPNAIDADMKVPIIFNPPYHTASKSDDVGIHSLFPDNWIGGGICGSVTWFIFIIWSLVCKEIPTFEDMYLDILMPLYMYKQKKSIQKSQPDVQINMMNQEEENEVKELYIEFLFVIWEFLKWSRDQLSDPNLFMLHLYKKKVCYLETFIYKQEKHKL